MTEALKENPALKNDVLEQDKIEFICSCNKINELIRCKNRLIDTVRKYPDNDNSCYLNLEKAFDEAISVEAINIVHKTSNPALIALMDNYIK